MFYRKKNRTRSRTALWVLAAYLSIWIGSAQGLSLFSILMDGSHQTFLAEKNAGIRLILHHPGFQDEHEPSPGHPAESQRGLLDKILNAGRGDIPAPDHEFYLSPNEQQITTAATVQPIT